MKTFIFFVWLFYAGSGEPRISTFGPFPSMKACDEYREVVRENYMPEGAIARKLTGCTTYVEIEDF
jgi:hypothetical protein